MKLAAIFALVGLVPGLLIYVVSYQFVTRSIESWFDVKVEGALSAGVNLARVSLDALATDMASKTRTASAQVAQVPDASAGVVLERIRDQLGATDVILWNSAGQAVASAGQSRFSLNPERPGVPLLRTVRQQRALTQIEGLDDIADPAAVQNARVKIIALVSSPTVGLLAEPRYLQATLMLPPALVENAIAVQEANREYQERALARGGLRRMYVGTLTLSLFLAVFGAVLLAVLLGNQLVRPLLVLAEGCARGGRRQPEPQGRPARQGRTGRADPLVRAHDPATGRRPGRGGAEHERGGCCAANLQTILDNLTAGVIVLDSDGRDPARPTPGPRAILRAAAWPPTKGGGAGRPGGPGRIRTPAVQKHCSTPFWGERRRRRAGPLATIVRTRRYTGVRSVAGPPEMRSAHHRCGGAQNCQIAGHPPPAGVRRHLRDRLGPAFAGLGRSGAPAGPRNQEPAHAHSAVRRAAGDEALGQGGRDRAGPCSTKSVKTIVDQVDAMKRLVNEFRDYARLPAAELQADRPQRPGERCAAAVWKARTPTVPVRMPSSTHAARPIIAGDAQQLRQVVHNLLQNAQDATPQAPPPTRQADDNTSVLIRTQLERGRARRVRLSVLGPAAPAFPNTSSNAPSSRMSPPRPRAPGWAWAVVKKIADEHGSRIDLGNRVEDGKVVGAQVSLSFSVVKYHTARPA